MTSSGRLVVNSRASCLDGAEGDVSILCLSLCASSPNMFCCPLVAPMLRRISAPQQSTHTPLQVQQGWGAPAASKAPWSGNRPFQSRAEHASPRFRRPVCIACTASCATCAHSVVPAKHSAKRSEVLFSGMVSGLLVSQDWYGARFPFKHGIDRESCLRISLGEMRRVPVSI